MKIDARAKEILGRAENGIAPSKEECIYLLSFPEASPEATLTRAIGNIISREKNDNKALIFGQIGLELFPCEADCKFCAFGKSHTSFTEKITLPEDVIRQKARDFTKDGDLYCLWLMTMATYDIDYFERAVRIAREEAPAQTLIYTNIGDTDYETFVRLKEAGADGVYHVVRLGEGVYTTIDPKKREETIENARRAGLALQDCVEPIGPEHTPEILAEHIFGAIEKNVDTIGAMRRTAVPGTQFTSEISKLRLAQICGVIALAALALEKYPCIPVHEADFISLASGANAICAETGVNPRDVQADTSAGRGLDVAACRDMLREAGFKNYSTNAE